MVILSGYSYIIFERGLMEKTDGVYIRSTRICVRINDAD